MASLDFRCENMLPLDRWPYTARCASHTTTLVRVPDEGEHHLCGPCATAVGASPTEEDAVAPGECQWFALCYAPAHRQVNHPILGWLYCCENHIAWMGDSVGPIR